MIMSGCFMIVTCFLSCAPVRDNPLDPQSEEYVTPKVDFLLESDNAVYNEDLDTIASDSVTLSWGAENPNIQYRYSIDNSEWSQWSTLPGISVFLPEGEHKLVVESQLSNNTAGVTDSIIFVVKSLPQNSIYLAPRFQTAGKNKAVVTVKTHAIATASMMHFTFSGAQIDSAWLPDSLSGKNLQLLYSQETVDIAALPGNLKLKGDMDLVFLRFKRLADDMASVNFTQYVVRDSLNKQIAIDTARGCLILR